MKRNSETLFHFTKSRETLELVLRNGFWPRYCVEDVQWAQEENSDTLQVAMPVVCFCDIPLSRIDDHVLFYGEFGLGLSRDWALRNALSPVHYVAKGDPVAEAFKLAHNLGVNHLPDNERTAFLAHIIFLAMHMKPLSGTMVVSGAPVEKDFYQESEWRYVAASKEFAPFLMPSNFVDPEILRSENEKTFTHGMLKFLPSDVRYIFVRSDSDIPAVMNFIQQNLDHHPAADLKVLMSRVTSLDSVRRDW
jgi:hypothetical protein